MLDLGIRAPSSGCPLAPFSGNYVRALDCREEHSGKVAKTKEELDIMLMMSFGPNCQKSGLRLVPCRQRMRVYRHVCLLPHPPQDGGREDLTVERLDEPVVAKTHMRNGEKKWHVAGWTRVPFILLRRRAPVPRAPRKRRGR
jgi:hypothetical protein